MCGFFFLYNPAAHDSLLLERSEAALQHLRHRGPDDEGLTGGTNWRMGHTRLSIIDLSNSKQPMSDPGRRFWFAYNGEVYNYKELRQSLLPHWQFRTNGDTEVVLAGLIHFGEDFMQRMEGMWAFSLWDNDKKTLLLSRDRIGKKPLYYQTTNQGLCCASELPALSCISDTRRVEDLDSSADYLRYGFYLPGKTAYKNVCEVLPGHNIHWTPGKAIREKQYWKLNITNTFPQDKQASLNLLRSHLQEAVHKRLVADVEVGAFLSGGIDSSLIVAILSRELNVKPKTFTIGFDDDSHDEREYARVTANLFQTEHKERCLHEWDRDLLKKLLFEHVGQPFYDSSLLPTAMVSQLASESVKVALSGDGGDELFSGYQRYQARALLRLYTRMPDFARAGLKKLIRSIPEPFTHHSRSVLKKAHLFLDVVDRQEAERPYVAPLLYSPNKFKCLSPELAHKGHKPPPLPESCHSDDILEMMVADALVYLPQDILLKVDRASMAYSLETRAPFLDHKLIELAFSLPVKWHRDFFGGKKLLRAAYADLLPDTIWKRRKQGFAVPVNSWLRNELVSDMKQMLCGELGFLNKKFIEQLLSEHIRRERDNGYRLWNIFVYLMWLQEMKN